MSRAPFLLLTLLMAALAAVVALEWRDPAPAPTRPAAATAPLPAALHPSSPLAESRQRMLADLLARPVFAPDRRPPQAARSTLAGPAAVPRLTGVLVSGTLKTAIFAADGSARPTMAEEGARIGDFVITSIAAGEVTMSGPDGLHVMRPSFDPAANRTSANAGPSGPPAKMSILDLLRNGPPPSPGVPGLPPQPGGPQP